MKITNVESIIVSAGPGKKNYCFVVVDTDEGIWGVGESGLSSRELAVAGAVEHLKSFIVGKNPFQIERLWQEMFRGGVFPAGNITTSAIAAIDIALWDIKGKALNVPIYELFGGLTPTSSSATRTSSAAAASRRWSRTPSSTSTRVGSSCAGAWATRWPRATSS